MEYEREEAEAIGMEVRGDETRLSKVCTTNKPLSPTISDSDSSCVSTESCGDTPNHSDYSPTKTNSITPFTKLPNPLLQHNNNDDDDDNNNNNNLYFPDITVTAQTHGATAFSVHQNGTTSVLSLQETNAGGDDLHVTPNASTAVGLKYFKEDSSSGPVSTDTVIVQNGIFNQSKKAAAPKPEQQSEPQVEEYDVERVIQKQETHDLICPNCRTCITKRVILRKRKRTFSEISTAEEASGSGHDLSASTIASDNITQGNQQSPHVGNPSDSRLDAISCFSCFSIFIPSGEGFLCWRFNPKADTTLQPGGTLTDIGQAEDSSTDSTGTIFPLWVVTCCQPSEREKPEASPHQTEPPLPSSDDIQVSSTPKSLLPEQIEATGRPYIEGNQQGEGTALQNKPLIPIKSYRDTPYSETPSNITAGEGSNLPLWFLTCCQPSTVGTQTDHSVKLDENEPPKGTPSAISGHTKPDHLVKPDETMPPKGTPSAPGGTESDYLTKPDKTVPQEEIGPAPSGCTRPSLVPSDDDPSSLFNPECPAIFVPGTSSPTKPMTTAKPVNDIPLPGLTESPAPGNAVLPMLFKPQPPVTPPVSHGAEPLVDIEPGLPPVPRRHGVSGLDIIKAVVYGALLESITSLSVITSAAGGDATTLNIVALGLANVFGGLVVLIHNLRVLKHEHTTEHYEAQLGRPGHYMLHAIVAIVSYLVFGLMSPIIYGFAFRKSDNKDYKMATLATAALGCITLLAAAKAYVRNPPKAYIRTVFYYVSLGVMVSGLGYVAGDVINTLLKKFGIFDSRAADNVPVLAAGVTNGAWSSF